MLSTNGWKWGADSLEYPKNCFEIRIIGKWYQGSILQHI